jgi:hypothetical protein
VDSIWDEIDGLMAQIVDADNPYPIGLKAMGAAIPTATSDSDLLAGVYLIWGSLTDGVELHPEDSANTSNGCAKPARNGSISKMTTRAATGLTTGSTTCAATPGKTPDARSAGPSAT